MTEENIENQENEHQCCCGHHHDENEEHQCCGGHHHDENEEHQCCGGHHHDENEEHQCCGGHGNGCCHHDEEAVDGDQNEQKIPNLEDIPDVPFPAPTLMSLTESIATQALVSLGLIPNPMTGKAVVRLNQAKHLIDTVELIHEKTKGNQTEEETKFIDGLMHELRMFYIRAK